MFDYKLLAALAAVVEQAGFERAAQTLGLSQSAVSQRVKLLEARVGQPVLLRGTPPRPTALGQRLLNHVQQVRLLERDLQGQVPALDDNRLPERLRIALNADSLATWWAGAVAPFCADHRVLLEHVVEDQAVGLKRMRAGEVAGCVCAAERPVAGARSQYLGAMRYRALASPAFIERYLPRQAAAEDLARVPAIVFGPDDRLQHRYMAAVGGTETFVHHLCPSSEGFVRMLQSGLGWGLVPQLQVRGELARGELVDVLSGPPIDVPLYWHHWRNGGALLDELTRHLVRCAGVWLVAE
ncbi:ArgP/LysG family DNA-binding transcriptional regulator [Stutzerimonas stutzeri]|uniref:ArgP/LysG family DNA-binding transcriptional regulator n=1 Tax=Stutzerimonas stutzeri TaxID=316 RepID=A0A2N8T5P8_STUST|nr:LysR family transcriptional regulator ArgP [Stutzerimonas stutzeri]MCQ4327291.1 LysR family transcriptional regulator ArgP [Stutzerimonas stutzeri]PNG10080.1 ArgP/LysG family DNA-binding transcriptional regulator [Stutzerimonas stutzeri]